MEHAAVLERLPADRPLPTDGPWPSLAMPTLVLATDADPLHPLSCAQAWAGALPAARLRTVTPKGVDEARHAAEVATAVDAVTRAPASAP